SSLKKYVLLNLKENQTITKECAYYYIKTNGKSPEVEITPKNRIIRLVGNLKKEKLNLKNIDYQVNSIEKIEKELNALGHTIFKEKNCNQLKNPYLFWLYPCGE